MYIRYEFLIIYRYRYHKMDKKMIQVQKNDLGFNNYVGAVVGIEYTEKTSVRIKLQLSNMLNKKKGLVSLRTRKWTFFYILKYRVLEYFCWSTGSIE